LRRRKRNGSEKNVEESSGSLQNIKIFLKLRNSVTHQSREGRGQEG
jgi:hypothetical protein